MIELLSTLSASSANYANFFIVPYTAMLSLPFLQLFEYLLRDRARDYLGYYI